MSDNVETRHVTVNEWEFRETSDGMAFSGYAAVFNSDSEPIPPGFTETIAPGAFAKSLRSRNNVFLLWSHDTSMPLASTRSKSLRLAEDSKGLSVDADLPNTSQGRDASELLRTSIADSMSFGFSVPRGGDSWSADGSRRELREVRLHEVSIVAFPAYKATSASVRSVDALADTTGEDPDALADAMNALERGVMLTADQAGILSTVIGKLSPTIEVVPTEPEPVAGPSLEFLKSKLDLAYKAI